MDLKWKRKINFLNEQKICTDHTKLTHFSYIKIDLSGIQGVFYCLGRKVGVYNDSENYKTSLKIKI